MEKAYDVKALIEKSRAKGGPDAEKLLKSNWAAIKEWLVESAALSENKIDDVAILAGIPAVDGLVMKALDQIDGVAGN